MSLYSKSSDLFPGILNSGSVASLWGSIAGSNVRSRYRSQVSLCMERIESCDFDAEPDVELNQRRNEDELEVPPCQPHRRAPVGKQAPGSRPRSSGFSGFCWSRLYTIIGPDRLSLSRPRPPTAETCQRRHRPNKDLLLSRWETPQLWDLPSPDLVPWHSCCKS